MKCPHCGKPALGCAPVENKEFIFARVPEDYWPSYFCVAVREERGRGDGMELDGLYWHGPRQEAESDG